MRPSPWLLALAPAISGFVIAQPEAEAKAAEPAGGESRVTALEEEYRNAYRAFGLKTRDQWVSIVRDRTSLAEDRAAAMEKWFASQKAEIDRINRLAEELDEIAPVIRPDSPPVKQGDTPEAELAHQLAMLSYRFRKGEIDMESLRRERSEAIAASGLDRKEKEVGPLDPERLRLVRELREISERFLSGEIDQARHDRLRKEAITSLRAIVSPDAGKE